MSTKAIKKEDCSELLCSVVLDYMGSMEQDPDDEYAEVKKDVREAIENPIIFHDSKMVHRIPQGSHLVVFDFGGLMPGNNLMEDQSREIIRWAQDHPSALVLIISDFTFRNFIKPEMEELGMDKLHNVVSWNRYDPLPEWPGIVAKK